MTWKKNGFGYSMWFLYAVLAMTALYREAGAVCGRLGFPLWVCLFAAGAVLFTGGIAAGATQIIRGRIGDRERRSPKWGPYAELLVLLLLLGAGIFLRVQAVLTGEYFSVESPYYTYAVVEEGGRIPQVAHGIVYVYLQLLHLVFWLVGNKMAAGVWLQMILQCLGLLCLYGGVRRLSGRLPAVLLVFFSCVSPYMAREALTLSPRMLYLLFYGAALYLVALCVEGSGKKPLWGLAAGLLVAGMTYLDLFGISLAFVFVGGLLARERTPGEEKGRGPMSFGLCVIAGAAGFWGLLWLDAVCSGKDFALVLGAWQNLYLPGEIRVPVLHELWSDGDALLTAFLSLGIFSFWCCGREEKLSVWTFTALPLLGAVLLGMFTKEADGGLWLYLFTLILAGCSLAQYFPGTRQAAGENDGKVAAAWGNMSETDEEGDEIPAGDGDIAGDAQEREEDGWEMAERIDPETGEEMGGEKARREKNRRKKGEKNREREDTGRKETTEEGAARTGEPGRVVTVTVRGETRQVKLLDNPLPLPKRREHKPMDYGLRDEEEDGYDFPVAEGDDFDI